MSVNASAMRMSLASVAIAANLIIMASILDSVAVPAIAVLPPTPHSAITTPDTVSKEISVVLFAILLSVTYLNYLISLRPL